MKKLLLLLLVFTGMVSTASATSDYSIQFDQDGNWYKLCDLTDEDGDGVYSAIVNMEEASKLGWGTCTIQLCTGESLVDGWGNALWANFDNDASILSYDYFTLSETYSKGGKLQIPIRDATLDTYAIKFDYTANDKTIRATRLIEFASTNDNWHSSDPVYMAETAHNSGIFQEIMTLPANTEFKFISNNNGGIGWYGNKDNSSIATDGSNISISEAGVYTITADFNDNYVAPARINVTASVGTYGMATLCSEYALDFTGITAVKAYTITAHNKENGTLEKSEVTGQVTAGTGLYIEGDPGASVNVPTTIYTTSAGTNMLVGVTSDTKIDQEDGANTNYILTVNKADGTTASEPKFFKVNVAGNFTVPAGKAYLQIPTAQAAHEFFWFEDEMTGIEKVSADTKALNGAVYNLAGQRVAQPTKGLYIVNGKKVVLK